MKTWRWFVGQVARLRRSIVGVFARDEQRRRGAEDHFHVADEPAPGPPAHWVERVRRGAPGLLEPSRRRRSEPAGPPVAQRAELSQTEPEHGPSSLDEIERRYEPPEPIVRYPRPEDQSPARPRLLRKFLRRERSVPTAKVDASPAPTADHNPREMYEATRHADETAESPTREPPERRRLEPPESPAAKPADRRRLVDETKPTPARRSSPRSDIAERSPQRSEVVEFEPPAKPQTAQAERAESPVQPIRADLARPPAANVSQAELAVDEIGPDRMWERAVPSPAPKRESNVERLREPAVLRPASQREPSAEPAPPPRRRAEPLAAIEKHPWPELPPPLDEGDGDVEAALRAWEHQRRIDHEQTRL
jgi:hypothetical protein